MDDNHLQYPPQAINWISYYYLSSLSGKRGQSCHYHNNGGPGERGCNANRCSGKHGCNGGGADADGADAGGTDAGESDASGAGECS